MSLKEERRPSSFMDTKRLLAAAAVLLLLIAAGDARAQTGYEEVSPEVLAMKFKPLSGDAPVTLAGPPKRATVLLIWASWCKPCREAAEGLSGMTGELRGLGAEVVGLTTESPQDGDAPVDYAAQMRLTFRSGWVEREAALALLGGRLSLPQILVFNRGGYITTRFVGYKDTTPVYVRGAVKKAVSLALRPARATSLDGPATPAQQATGDTTPFDLTATKLPPGYTGTDLGGLARAFDARKQKLVKDEFETTAQHQERVRIEEAKPLYGSLTRESLLAVVIPVSASYDADSETMTVKAAVPENVEGLTFRERGESTYGTKVKMDIPTARRSKPELRALVVFNLIPPYISEGRLTAAAREVWFFDNATGQVIERNAKKAEPAPDPALAEIARLVEAGNDDDALARLRDVVRVQPMNPGAYLLTGKIYRKRGETAAAISQLKAAIFWDSDHTLVEPHVLLAQIYFERGDRAQATAYVQSALEIDPTNREALSLRRQLEAPVK